MLGVGDGADVVEDLAGVDGFAGRVGVGERGRGLLGKGFDRERERGEVER